MFCILEPKTRDQDKSGLTPEQNSRIYGTDALVMFFLNLISKQYYAYDVALNHHKMLIFLLYTRK